MWLILEVKDKSHTKHSILFYYYYFIYRHACMAGPFWSKGYVGHPINKSFIYTIFTIEFLHINKVDKRFGKK